MPFEDAAYILLNNAREAEGAFNDLLPSPVRRTAFLAHGLVHHAHPVDARDRDAEIAHRTKVIDAWLEQEVEPVRSRSVLLDTTTLAAVEKLLADGAGASITPASLLDLSTFTHAVLLFDNVLHMESSTLDSRAMNEAIGGADPPLRPLPVQSYDERNGMAPTASDVYGVSATLVNAMEEAQEEMSRLLTVRRDGDRPAAGTTRAALDGEAAREISAAWTAVLGYPPTAEDLFGLDLSKWWSYGRANIELLERAQSLGEYVGEPSAHPAIRQLITESNARGIFNARISELLCVPYLPNSTRLPFRPLWLARYDTVMAQLADVATLDAEMREAATLSARGTALQIPLFLNALLGSVSARGDIPRRLGELRDEARSWREVRAEYLTALDRGEQRRSRELVRALDAEGLRLGRLLGVGLVAATAVVLAPVSSVAITVALATLAGLGLTSGLGPADRERLLRRIRRRHLTFITRSAQTAEANMNAYPLVTKLWSVPASIGPDAFAARFARIGSLADYAPAARVT